MVSILNIGYLRELLGVQSETDTCFAYITYILVYREWALNKPIAMVI